VCWPKSKSCAERGGGGGSGDGGGGSRALENRDITGICDMVWCALYRIREILDLSRFA
jgi:hypothetical protein